jgi:ferredoxin
MLETRQLHPTLAREVVGLSLWEQLDGATVAELRAKVEEAVRRCPKQAITIEG